MPELPEVETVVRGLSQLVGRSIARVEVFKPLVLKTPIAKFSTALQGKTVQSVSRHGKAIFWVLDDGSVVRLHLGMTGAILFTSKSEKSDPYVRIRFHLGTGENDLVFRDVRQFGKVSLAKEAREIEWGPDAWASTLDVIAAAVRKKDGMIKHALLNQHVIAGMGNIYVDETLFLAKIHPRKRLGKLSKATIANLCGIIREVLGRAIGAGGTSFRDYVNTAGKKGDFKRLLNVYGQQGKPCPNCKTVIKKIVVASRGTHFCPRCQKR